MCNRTQSNYFHRTNKMQKNMLANQSNPSRKTFFSSICESFKFAKIIRWYNNQQWPCLPSLIMQLTRSIIRRTAVIYEAKGNLQSIVANHLLVEMQMRHSDLILAASRERSLKQRGEKKHDIPGNWSINSGMYQQPKKKETNLWNWALFIATMSHV